MTVHKNIIEMLPVHQMNQVVTFQTNILEIVEAESDVRIIDVVRCQVNLVMDDVPCPVVTSLAQSAVL